MSNSNSTNSGTSGNQGSQGVSSDPYSFQLLQKSDFFVRDGLLHPIAIGSIAIIVTFAYLRISSCRTIAPFTLFDTLINVALGSTLAGIVNGNDLSRGLLGLITLAVFQAAAAFISSRRSSAKNVFIKPPLIVAFRGRALESLMRKHHIAETDLYQALRSEKIWDIREVEAAIIEPTGAFTIYKREGYPKDYEPLVLLAVSGYRALVDKEEAEKAEKHEPKRETKSDGPKGRDFIGNSVRRPAKDGVPRASAEHVDEEVGNRSEGDRESLHSQSSVADRAAKA